MPDAVLIAILTLVAAGGTGRGAVPGGAMSGWLLVGKSNLHVPRTKYKSMLKGLTKMRSFVSICRLLAHGIVSAGEAPPAYRSGLSFSSNGDFCPADQNTRSPNRTPFSAAITALRRAIPRLVIGPHRLVWVMVWVKA